MKYLIGETDTMAKRRQHLDDLFENFPYAFGEVAARKVAGSDGRDVLQLRIDMGILQLEIDGRPDGTKPEGFDSFFEYLLAAAEEEGDDFELDEERCIEIDREFVQFFHRRISFLALREFELAVRDAEHTLSLMDLSSTHAPDESWAMAHEQYRPFVLFHRTQAAALVMLDAEQPDRAVEEIDTGLKRIHGVFVEHEVEEEFEDDDLVLKLNEMKESIAGEFDVQPSLNQQLARAIADERYEVAAELRDKIAHKRNKSI